MRSGCCVQQKNVNLSRRRQIQTSVVKIDGQLIKLQQQILCACLYVRVCVYVFACVRVCVCLVFSQCLCPKLYSKQKHNGLDSPPKFRR